MLFPMRVRPKGRKTSSSKDEIEIYSSVFKLGIPEVDKVLEDHGYPHLVPYETFVERTLPKQENMEDRISRLPDDILQFIISLLTMREGASASILSPQWRNLWSKSVSRFNFNDTNLFGYEYPQDLSIAQENSRRRLRIHRISQRRRIVGNGFLENQRSMFIRRVNHILKLCQASTIDTFMVSFPMGDESATHVDRWIKFAAAQGVIKLELDFNWTRYDLWCDHENKYDFPVQEFGSSLSYLRLSFCVFDFPPHFKGLNSLVSLDLSYTYLTNNNVTSILSNCPSLEWLSFGSCEFPYPSILEFTGPSIKLKHLSIYNCFYIKEIKLHDMNILSFELVVPLGVFESSSEMLLGKKVSIKNVPHLARLVLHVEWLVEISGSVPSLATLFVRHKFGKLPLLSAFKNIKRLVFSACIYMANLSKVVCLLEICPLLQQMEVNMGTFEGIEAERSEESTKISMLPRCPHSNLNEVLIYAFENYPEHIELARYLLKNAIVLEKMKIYTTCKSYATGGIWSLSENGKLVGKELEKVRNLLQKEARPSTELLIVSHQ